PVASSPDSFCGPSPAASAARVVAGRSKDAVASPPAARTDLRDRCEDMTDSYSPLSRLVADGSSVASGAPAFPPQSPGWAASQSANPSGLPSNAWMFQKMSPPTCGYLAFNARWFG